MSRTDSKTPAGDIIDAMKRFALTIEEIVLADFDSETRLRLLLIVKAMRDAADEERLRRLEGRT